MTGSGTLSDVVARTLSSAVTDPDPGDVLRLYVELPTVVRNYRESPFGEPVRVRSSFEAAYTDARAASNGGTSWIGAIGYLCFFDQLGGAIRRRDRDVDARNHVERALRLFSDLDADRCAALYALRCCLAHDFSLANHAEEVPRSRRHLYCHHFRLWPAREHWELLTFPERPWDGDAFQVSDTDIDLGHLEDLATDVKDRVVELYQADALALAIPAPEVRRRYFFVHTAGSEVSLEDDA